MVKAPICYNLWENGVLFYTFGKGVKGRNNQMFCTDNEIENFYLDICEKSNKFCEQYNKKYKDIFDINFRFVLHEINYTTQILFSISFDFENSFDNVSFDTQETHENFDESILVFLDSVKDKLFEKFKFADYYKFNSFKKDENGNYNADNYIIFQNVSADNSFGFFLQITDY